MLKRVFAMMLAVVLIFGGVVNADTEKCEKAETYRKIVMEKFMKPQEKKDSLVLLNRDIITPELAKKKCNSLDLERGSITTWLTDEKTGKKLTTADVTTFLGKKLMENTSLNDKESTKAVEFTYKEDMPYLKLWMQNKGNSPMKIMITEKGAESKSMPQDSFEIAPNHSQVIYYYADATAKNKTYVIQVTSEDKMPLKGMMAMKSLQKVVERKENVQSVFGD